MDYRTEWEVKRDTPDFDVFHCGEYILSFTHLTEARHYIARQIISARTIEFKEDGSVYIEGVTT